MINPAVLIGEPLCFKKNIKIYPPTVKDVVANPNFNVYYKILTITEDDVREDIGKKIPQGEQLPSVFEYIILNCQYVKDFISIFNDSIKFFCHLSIKPQFEEKIFEFINDDGDVLAVIAEEEYFDFQNAIRLVVGDKAITPPEPADPNEDPRIRRIKEKARERDRIKARQSAKNGISLTVCLVAICCMGIGITPLNIGEMSYAAVGDLMKMMQDKEKYDIDIRSLLAGADSKKVKPKYWIRNIND